MRGGILKGEMEIMNRIDENKVGIIVSLMRQRIQPIYKKALVMPGVGSVGFCIHITLILPASFGASQFPQKNARLLVALIGRKFYKEGGCVN